MASKKKAKPVAAPKSDLDALVGEWVEKAPAIRGLRRPGTRMKAAALLQKMDRRGLAARPANQNTDQASGSESDTPASGKNATALDIEDTAEFVADIDELLATLGGDAYIEWIEKVPLEGGLQVAVLIELFTSRIYPELGKG